MCRSAPGFREYVSQSYSGIKLVPPAGQFNVLKIMTTLREFFSIDENDLKGIVQKNNLLKKSIIAYMAIRTECTLSDLAAHLHISIPTTTKLVAELVAEKIVVDNGKIETAGGRRPNIFGLANSAIYFAGVEVGRDKINMTIIDLHNNIIIHDSLEDFTLADTPQCLELIGDTIENFLEKCGIDRQKILGVGVCITGRVNQQTGRSYKYFTSQKKSLREILEQRTGHKVLIENDTRAMCYAEYNQCCPDLKNILYLNLGQGVGIGIIIDGKLYYGKSGFAGEFGHIPFFDNEIICACGKKGCLETEVSGPAIEKKMRNKIASGSSTILCNNGKCKPEEIHLKDIIEAAKKDDMLSIELIEQASEKIGKGVAMLVNLYNPELIIIGGDLSTAGDYMLLPLKAAANKFSLSLVANDTEYRLSDGNEQVGAFGVAMLIHDRILGL